MVRCDDIREALSAALDGEATRLEQVTLDQHLATCAGCAAWAADLHAVHGRLGQAPRPTAPTALRSRIAALSCEDSGAVEIPAPARGAVAWLPRFLRTPAFAVALIMLVAMAAFVRSSGLLLPGGLRTVVAEHLAQRGSAPPAPQAIAEANESMRTSVAAYSRFAQEPQVEGDFLHGRVARVCEADAAHFAFTDEDGRPLSFFVMPAACEHGDWGEAVRHHGKLYNVARYRGHTIVSWNQHGSFCVLLCPSTDHELLEQAHRVQTGFDESSS